MVTIIAARSISRVPKACRIMVDRASCRNLAGFLSLSHLQVSAQMAKKWIVEVNSPVVDDRCDEQERRE